MPIDRHSGKICCPGGIGQRVGSHIREGIDVKSGFVAPHRGIWPAEWLCEVLGVSRGVF
jgi:hypothetical protein